MYRRVRAVILRNPVVESAVQSVDIALRRDSLCRGIYNTGNLARETGREKNGVEIGERDNGRKRDTLDGAIRQRGKKGGRNFSGCAKTLSPFRLGERALN